MRIPVSWLREYVALPQDIAPRALAEALIRVGLEVETVETVDVDGPLVIGRVLEFVEEPQKNGKTIRWCQVDVGNPDPQGIVCGARNFAVGDLVVVAMPGCVLPGGFAIAARKTYGHVSAGMICSATELGIADDHSGIMVLDRVLDPEALAAAVPGVDARGPLGLPDAVLDIAVTPDRGYCLSIRGVAREAAMALGVAFTDPAAAPLAPTTAGGYPVEVVDTAGCTRFAARIVRGVRADTPSPLWLQRRVHLAGMRSISLTVDITNYVMLELGQPIHGYDASLLQGPIRVRSASAGERLTTLDETTRALDAADLVIADDSGAIGLAGVMGGATTELSSTTTDIVVEAAHFDQVRIAAAARRHKLPSEASRRFERGVDPALPLIAATRVATLLADLAGGTVDPAVTDVRVAAASPSITFDLQHPARLAGCPITSERAEEILTQVGCTVEPVGQASGDVRQVLPPSWRPDLTTPVTLVEEVLRVVGYDQIPSRVPVGPARVSSQLGRSLQNSIQIGRRLASQGGVEVRNYPFIGSAVLDTCRIEATDVRRRLVRIVNPISDEEPFLRTTLLPGLVTVARRNLGRGFSDLNIFEIGRVFRAVPGQPAVAPRPSVAHRPSVDELAELDRALPEQPLHAAVLLTGNIEPAGWWGAGRPATWADAVETARGMAEAIDASLTVRQGSRAPWHPGRCAELLLSGETVGFAGELHPGVLSALGLPARTCAVEVDLTAIARFREPFGSAPKISGFPVAREDVALVVSSAVPAATVTETLRSAGGPLLESVRLFDVYESATLGEGARSLAFALTMRAPDRTLTDADIKAVREAVIAAAAEAHGAVLRGA